jgi:hypothetical protein
MSSYTSLDSVTEPVEGQERQLRKATAHHTMMVTVEGTPMDCRVVLEGAHNSDGHWTVLGNVQSAIGGLVTTNPTTHLVTWVRARVDDLTLRLNEYGEPDPAYVTVSIASADDA